MKDLRTDQTIWEVWQGRTLICSKTMKLTKWQALNKVENEARLGFVMEARPAPEPKRRKKSAGRAAEGSK